MTRSGIVQSVHAFGEDPQLTVLFSIFMVALLIFSFGWLIYRLPLLRGRNELESWASREAAFLLNNWILLFSAFFILFATMFPTISEAVTGQRITVGPPFFNTWMVPIGLILLLLTGVGPLLAWRKSSLSNLVYQFAWPASFAVITAVGLYAIGFRVWASGLCFALCSFVVGTIGQECIRGAIVRRTTTGTDLVTALIGLVMRSRRRYGGYIVHVGIVLMFLGFAGAGYKLEQQIVMNLGDETTVGHFMVRHDRLSESDDGQKQMVTAHLTLFKDGEQVGQLYPARWFFRKHETEPTTEVAIRRSVSEDFYVTLASYDLGDQSASFQLTVNPLVNWIWFGFTMLAFGTGIALLPESKLAFMGAKVPTGATTAPILVLALALGITTVSAQSKLDTGQLVGLTPEKQAFETELKRELVCVCGSCSHLPLSDCTCGTAESMRMQLSAQVALGKDRDEVYQYFIDTYGSQEPLGSPIGAFNQLAWLFPMLVGSSVLFGGIGIVVFRWSRRGLEFQESHLSLPEDEQLEARLDNELKNFD
jgi:cytochrome c-type biogenesis protein CcmF